MLPSKIDAIVLDILRRMHIAVAVTNFHSLMGLVHGIVVADDQPHIQNFLLIQQKDAVGTTLANDRTLLKKLRWYLEAKFLRRKSTTAKPKISPGYQDWIFLLQRDSMYLKVGLTSPQRADHEHRSDSLISWKQLENIVFQYLTPQIIVRSLEHQGL